MDALFDAKFDGDLVSVDNVWINNTQAGLGCVADTQIQLTARLDEQFGSQVRDHAGTPVNPFKSHSWDLVLAHALGFCFCSNKTAIILYELSPDFMSALSPDSMRTLRT